MFFPTSMAPLSSLGKTSNSLEWCWRLPWFQPLQSEGMTHSSPKTWKALPYPVSFPPTPSSSFKHHLSRKVSTISSDWDSLQSVPFVETLAGCNDLTTCLLPPGLQSRNKSFLSIYYVSGPVVGAWTTVMNKKSTHDLCLIEFVV